MWNVDAKLQIQQRHGCIEGVFCALQESLSYYVGNDGKVRIASEAKPHIGLQLGYFYIMICYMCLLVQYCEKAHIACVVSFGLWHLDGMQYGTSM